MPGAGIIQRILLTYSMPVLLTGIFLKMELNYPIEIVNFAITIKMIEWLGNC